MEVVISDNESDNCSACAAAALCKHSGGTIRIHVANPADFTQGQRVRIGASNGTHRRAVGLMLGLPCLMLILPIVSLCQLGVPEWAALLAGIGACTLTYLILWWCRKDINTNHQFIILT
ncbi:MAG: SoxR reducing system RseC family protein [Muribaculaceae bacterium]|nr:SoxR reducing system RseC family protein [Muribaculaceae bacterium]